MNESLEKEKKLENEIEKELTKIILLNELGDFSIWEIVNQIGVIVNRSPGETDKLMYILKLIDKKVLSETFDKDDFDYVKSAEFIYKGTIKKIKKYKNSERLIKLVQECGEEAGRLFKKNKPKLKSSWIKNLFRNPIEDDMGNCHSIWAIQKKLIKERHKLDWLTPAERFPGAKFD